MACFMMLWYRRRSGEATCRWCWKAKVYMCSEGYTPGKIPC
jgi:hypothetical protein